MSKLNIKKEHGFTIVELLVVIVVIGILAAITIVSYTGITSRAKAARAQSNANSVQSVAEIYFSDTAQTGYYPTNAAALTGYTTGAAKIPTGITVSAAAQNKPDASEGEATIRYMAKSGNTGACIGWYDFSAASTPIKYVYLGSATAADFTVPTCS